MLPGYSGTVGAPRTTAASDVDSRGFLAKYLSDPEPGAAGSSGHYRDLAGESLHQAKVPAARRAVSR